MDDAVDDNHNFPDGDDGEGFDDAAAAAAFYKGMAKAYSASNAEKAADERAKLLEAAKEKEKRKKENKRIENERKSKEKEANRVKAFAKQVVRELVNDALRQKMEEEHEQKRQERAEREAQVAAEKRAKQVKLHVTKRKRAEEEQEENKKQKGLGKNVGIAVDQNDDTRDANKKTPLMLSPMFLRLRLFETKEDDLEDDGYLLHKIKNAAIISAAIDLVRGIEKYSPVFEGDPTGAELDSLDAVSDQTILRLLRQGWPRQQAVIKSRGKNNYEMEMGCFEALLNALRKELPKVLKQLGKIKEVSCMKNKPLTREFLNLAKDNLKPTEGLGFPDIGAEEGDGPWGSWQAPHQDARTFHETMTRIKQRVKAYSCIFALQELIHLRIWKSHNASDYFDVAIPPGHLFIFESTMTHAGFAMLGEGHRIHFQIDDDTCVEQATHYEPKNGLKQARDYRVLMNEARKSEKNSKPLAVVLDDDDSD